MLASRKKSSQSHMKHSHEGVQLVVQYDKHSERHVSCSSSSLVARARTAPRVVSSQRGKRTGTLKKHSFVIPTKSAMPLNDVSNSNASAASAPTTRTPYKADRFAGFVIPGLRCPLPWRRRVTTARRPGRRPASPRRLPPRRRPKRELPPPRRGGRLPQPRPPPQPRRLKH